MGWYCVLLFYPPTPNAFWYEFLLWSHKFVCDSAVHFFFENLDYCHFYAVCCLLCCHVLCLVFFSLNTYYLRTSFVNFYGVQPCGVLLLVTFSSVRHNIYPFPKISVCLLHLLLKTITDISELECVALGRVFPFLHLAS